MTQLGAWYHYIPGWGTAAHASELTAEQAKKAAEERLAEEKRKAAIEIERQAREAGQKKGLEEAKRIEKKAMATIVLSVAGLGVALWLLLRK